MFVVGDLGFMGNTHNFTPNIDRIAEETVMFTIAYSMHQLSLVCFQVFSSHGVYTIISQEGQV